MSIDTRYPYRVPGPVSDAARAALDARYGKEGWFSPEEEEEKRLARLRRETFFGTSFEPSYVFRPADPTGYLLRKPSP